ncbi:UNVERIFIED_CONTAM: Glutamyl-tRNA(Gln) amidotransferase subunit A [Sesamum angustifolium]|uniref:Glutamyl-tRNA(Gln) amidotransferase subunit A n=1 Tax=Sesamum angustifolium TaxID=2727405 RepID=A0AAW2LIC8_9LAMI
MCPSPLHWNSVCNPRTVAACLVRRRRFFFNSIEGSELGSCNGFCCPYGIVSDLRFQFGYMCIHRMYVCLWVTSMVACGLTNLNFVLFCIGILSIFQIFKPQLLKGRFGWLKFLLPTPKPKNILAVSSCVERVVVVWTAGLDIRQLNEQGDSGEMHFRNYSKCSGKIDHDPSCSGFRMLDADFFSDAKMLEIQKGAEELNIPIIRSNRKLVASVNGGLENPSSLVFRSAWNHDHAQDAPKRFDYPSLSGVERPESDEDIAFMSILELGQLIKSKQITSEELVRIFLNRLKRYPLLYAIQCLCILVKFIASIILLFTAAGPLHGIPYGLKDIIAVPHYKTTWGSKSFKNQVLDIEAWVYKRLKSAGAVLLAKLVTGSLAYDDIWFGGRTRNPWNIEEYSTGSSAGPAASTSAGLVPFAIGSETAGSITYPAARCVLNPIYSQDKLGPFSRDAAGCAVVLDVIRGKDPDDLSSRDIPFSDPFAVDITKLNVGYLEDAEMDVVEKLRSKGVNMIPFKLNYSVDSAQGILNFTMDVDMLAHFDEWQRSGKDDDYEAQDQWPLELRRARVVPAVDYVQAQRARGKLIREVRDNFKVHSFVGNATDWELVCVGNLVGMPVIVIPTGFKPISDAPTNNTRRRATITTGIYAPPDHDHIALALAMAYQSVTDHHKQHPPIDDLGPEDSIPNPPTRTIPPRQLRGL